MGGGNCNVPESDAATEEQVHDMGLGGKPYLERDPAVGPALDIFIRILGSGRCPNR